MSKLFDDASLAMIPSAYKDGKLYSIRPTDGSGDFTFSRGSNLAATRVDVNGLIEKGRENLVPYSNAFNTGWDKDRISTTSGQTGYDGSSDAWLIVADLVNNNHQIRRSDSTLDGVQTNSVYAKYSGYHLQLRATGIGATNIWVNFDLQNGTIERNGGGQIDAKIESVANGFYRCSITYNPSSASYIGIVMIQNPTTDGALPSFVGDLTSGIIIQDAQVERSLVATDYIETGASTAQAGILEDMPRLDYSGGASCPSLLLEPQRSNLVTHSEYALDSSWTTQLGTLTANAATSPEGVDNAVKFLETAASGRHRTFTSHNTSAGTYCVSVFMKDGNRGYGFLHWAMEGGDGRFSIVVDLSDGEVVDTMNFSGAEVIVDYGTEDYGNGWYRAYIVGTKASSNVSYVNFGLASSDNDTNSSGTPSYTGDGTHYAYFYGMQTEEGSYPTSYIPTYGSSVTRSVDDMANLDIPDFNNNISFSVLLELTRNGISSSEIGSMFSFYNDSSTQQFWFHIDAPNSQVRLRDATNSNATMATISFDTDDRKKIAFSCDGSTLKTYADGVLSNTYNLVNVFNVDELRTAAKSFDVHQILTFPTALTDSECIALTTL